MATGDKDPGALLTIGELSRDLGVAQHILRYWESRFPQLKPMQRAGNRRYYRPADVALVRKIDRLLNHEGYTVRGVQKLLRDKSDANGASPEAATPTPSPAATTDHYSPPIPPPMPALNEAPSRPSIDVARLVAIRDRLAQLIDG